MKSCPTCKRTFEDTFTFCLVDGTILSPPFDPQATQSSKARDTNPPPTEVLHQEPAPNNALPVIVASPISMTGAQPVEEEPTNKAATEENEFDIYGRPTILKKIGRFFKGPYFDPK